MAQLALKLSEVLHQPVLDTTGVSGKFDVKLEWTPDDLRNDLRTKPPSADYTGNAPEPVGPPSIFTALQEQLGLKLEFAKVPAEVIVIDSAEKPSEN